MPTLRTAGRVDIRNLLAHNDLQVAGPLRFSLTLGRGQPNIECWAACKSLPECHLRARQGPQRPRDTRAALII